VHRNLHTLKDEGHRVDFACMRRPGEKYHEEDDGFGVYRFLGRKQRAGKLNYILEYAGAVIRAFLSVTWLAMRQRYDAVEVDTLPDAMVFGTVVAKLRGARIVLYLFECMPELFEASYDVPPSHIAPRILRFIEIHAQRYADVVLYVAPGCQEIQEPRAGVPLKCDCILNVPDEAVFPPGPPPTSDSAPADRTFRVTTHGTVLQKYGNHVLVKAAARLKGKIPNLEIVIAGEGEFLPELKRLAAELDVEDVVRFTGWVPPEELREILVTADIGVVTILYDHFLPSKLFEYMVSKRPIVCSRIGFVSSFCTNDEVLFYTPGSETELAEAVLRLWRNGEERAAYPVRAAELYARYRWPEMRKRYVAVYDDLLRTPDPPAGDKE
jgi:glycosyltransferase involved in cell wall biosynthesis